IYCRQADTVFFRINASRCYTYSLSYEMLPITPGDAEPNNSYATAVSFDYTDTVEGRICYSGSSTDDYDYFYSVLPEDGTLRIYLDKHNMSNSSGADFYLYVYNKAQSNIGYKASANDAVDAHDAHTLDIYCRQADTVFFRINASQCYT